MSYTVENKPKCAVCGRKEGAILQKILSKRTRTVPVKIVGDLCQMCRRAFFPVNNYGA